jgi:hypothetical protein
MSDNQAVHDAARSGDDSQKPGKPPKQYKLNVDGRQLETTEPRLTGLQIKALAGVDATFALYLEGKGQHPDQPISDSELVDLEAHGREAFYTAPPANYGVGERRAWCDD